MSKSHCIDCGSAFDAREMLSCTCCGAYVCTRCAGRQNSRCADCAGLDDATASI